MYEDKNAIKIQKGSDRIGILIELMEEKCSWNRGLTLYTQLAHLETRFLVPLLIYTDATSQLVVAITKWPPFVTTLHNIKTLIKKVYRVP